MTAAALCHADSSQLVVIDVQARLAAAMAPDDRARVLRNAGLLLRAAGLLAVPVTYTEQYPKGLGPMEPDLAALLPDDAVRAEKTTFSCCGEESFRRRVFPLHRRQVVVAGMEAHVCVLQTVLELIDHGHEVFVAEDAVSSRDAGHRRNALERMRDAGAIITNAESVAFEWLRDARHEHFKTVSAWLR